MYDLTIFCRTCMCQIVGNADVTLKSYDINEYLGLAEKLEQCFSIKVKPFDGYPPRLCEICYVKICDFYEFEQMCRHSLVSFTEMLAEHKAQVENINKVENALIIDIEETKHFQDNEIEVKSEHVQGDYNPYNSHLSESSNSVELVEEIAIQILDLDTPQRVYFNKRKRQLAVGDTADGVKCMKLENPLSEGEESGFNAGKEECESIHEEETREATAADSSYEENSEYLSEDEVSILDDVVQSSASSGDENERKAPKKKLQCSICPQRFNLQRCLDSHMRTHQGLMDHPCPREKCGKSYRRLCDLRQHLRDHDGLPREYRCARDGCNWTFNRYSELLKHRIEKHGAPEFYKCDEDGCGQEFKSSTYLRRHKEKQHYGGPEKPPSSHMCDTCGVVLRSAATLRMHSLIHVERSQWPFACDVEGCSKRFRVQQQLTIHKNRHAGIKNFACPHCDRRFVTSTNMKNHINTHTRERTWSCELCPKVCTTPDILRKHTENKHGIIKRYPCRICQRHFNTAKAKMYHEMTHVGNEEENTNFEWNTNLLNRFPCDYCDRAFESLSRKKYHEMIHTGEKPHVCEECGKGFRTSTLLKTHKKSHMKDMPRENVCPVCDRSFFSALSLKHHKMKHTKEKPYKCEECGFSFRWPNNLTRHRKLHLRDKALNEGTSPKNESVAVLE